MTLPRVWLVPYLKGWTYDITARAIAEQLAHRFEFRIAHQADVDAGELEKWDADVVVDMWWKGTMYRRRPERVVKQVSSHRWSFEHWGSHSPYEVLDRFARGVKTVIVPSQRLRAMLEAVRPGAVRVAPKGFDPSLLEDHRMRGGELRVGWAGAAAAPDKCVEILVAADPTVRIADLCLTQGEMSDFYNGIDVIAVSSIAEGDPRPLIEGMACGCFPVATDVGIVPELVSHGVNGLIVERSVEAFSDAFAWCRRNLDAVRAAGALNAVRMREQRTWASVAPSWGDAFDQAIEASRR